MIRSTSLLVRCKCLQISAILCLIFSYGPHSIQAAPEGSHKILKGRPETPTFTIDELLKAGWKAPRPPYPFAAYAKKEEGTVYVELSTNASGKVIKATALKKSANYPDLREQLVQMALAQWHGQPNTRVITFMTFKLS